MKFNSKFFVRFSIGLVLILLLVYLFSPKPMCSESVGNKNDIDGAYVFSDCEVDNPA